jgi:hypothetical protein
MRVKLRDRTGLIHVFYYGLLLLVPLAVAGNVGPAEHGTEAFFAAAAPIAGAILAQILQ